jgi:DNA-binding MarR family transcriptional regulator
MGRVDRETFRAWMNLLQAHSVLVEALESRLQTEKSLSLAEHEVLTRLIFAPEGRLRMLDLSNLLLISKSGATRLVDRLARNGFVKREDSPTDRRVTYALITSEGRRLLRDSEPVLFGALEEHFSSHLSDADVRALRRSLRKILVGNGEWEDARCSPGFAQAKRRAG